MKAKQIQKGDKVKLSKEVTIRIAPSYAFWPGTSLQKMAITNDMYETVPHPHAGETGQVIGVFDGGLVDIRWADGSRSTEVEETLMSPNI